MSLVKKISYPFQCIANPEAILHRKFGIFFTDITHVLHRHVTQNKKKLYEIVLR